MTCAPCSSNSWQFCRLPSLAACESAERPNLGLGLSTAFALPPCSSIHSSVAEQRCAARMSEVHHQQPTIPTPTQHPASVTTSKRLDVHHVSHMQGAKLGLFWVAIHLCTVALQKRTRFHTTLSACSSKQGVTSHPLQPFQPCSSTSHTVMWPLHTAVNSGVASLSSPASTSAP